MQAAQTGTADSSQLDRAFESLKTYQPGSGRGVLLPLDEAARVAIGNEAERRGLERRLLLAVEHSPADVARDYIFAKLVLVGSGRSAAVLERFLDSPELANAARNALEAIAGSESIQALRRGLDKTHGIQRIGVIHSLGTKRDAKSVRTIARLAAEADLPTVRAALAALGQIGSIQAARSLKLLLVQVPDPMREAAADAALNCADLLTGSAGMEEAKAVFLAIQGATLPKHFREAARRELASRRPT